MLGDLSLVGVLLTSAGDDGYLAVESAHGEDMVRLSALKMEWSLFGALASCRVDDPDEGSGIDSMVLYLKLHLRRRSGAGMYSHVVTEGHEERVLLVFDSTHDVELTRVHCLMLTNQGSIPSIRPGSARMLRGTSRRGFEDSLPTSASLRTSAGDIKTVRQEAKCGGVSLRSIDTFCRSPTCVVIHHEHLNADSLVNLKHGLNSGPWPFRNTVLFVPVTPHACPFLRSCPRQIQI
jgi:hypothetical protein